MRYVRYNVPGEIKKLDQNNITDFSIWPRRIYTAPVIPPRRYICDGIRDVERHYVHRVERNSHPDSATRFGYARGVFGWSHGQFPGRFNVQPGCEDMGIPKNMAPKCFYE